MWWSGGDVVARPQSGGGGGDGHRPALMRTWMRRQAALLDGPPTADGELATAKFDRRDQPPPLATSVGWFQQIQTRPLLVLQTAVPASRP